MSSDPASHWQRGSAGYRRASLALFCAGFATFALLYCVQPLLPLLAAHFAVSAASSSLALSLTTLSLALTLLLAGAGGKLGTQGRDGHGAGAGLCVGAGL